MNHLAAWFPGLDMLRASPSLLAMTNIQSVDFGGSDLD